MPVEIRELTIQVNVNRPEDSKGAGGAASGGAGEAGQKDVVKEAVEEVMRILENKNER
jgi:hypothetical protein